MSCSLLIKFQLLLLYYYIIFHQMSRNIRKALIPKVQQIINFYDEQAYFLTEHTKNIRLLSAQIQTRIKSLKQTCAYNNIVSLASNQISRSQNFFVIHSKCNEINMFKNTAYHQADQYQEYINAKIVKAQNIIEHQEQCCSFPFIKAKVRRFNKIVVQYRNINKQQKQQQLNDLHARMFQHQLDHMYSKTLLNWEHHRGNLSFCHQSLSQFPKSSHIIVEFNEKIKKVLVDYPQLLSSLETVDSLNKQFSNSNQISFNNDFIKRLCRNFKRQITFYKARQSLQ